MVFERWSLAWKMTTASYLWQVLLMNQAPVLPVSCGNKLINGFSQYCLRSRNEWFNCNPDVCNLPDSEDIRKQCFLYCEKVPQKLRDLVSETQKNTELSNTLESMNGEMTSKDQTIQLYQTLVIVFVCIIGVCLAIYIVYWLFRRYRTRSQERTNSILEEVDVELNLLQRDGSTADSAVSASKISTASQTDSALGQDASSGSEASSSAENLPTVLNSSTNNVLASIPPQNSHVDPTTERDTRVQYAIGGRRSDVPNLPESRE